MADILVVGLPVNLLPSRPQHILVEREVARQITVIVRHSADGSLFRRCHGLRRISLFITGTVFHFHKHKIFPVSADNVDLTVPTSAEIPFQDTHSLFLQIVRSHLLIYIPRLSGIQPLCFPPFATLSFTMR